MQHLVLHNDALLSGFTHMMGGVASLWILTLFPDFLAHPMLLVIAALGGLFPDIDTPKSFIANIMIGPRRWRLRVFGLAGIVAQTVEHRGLLHSPVATGAFSLLGWWAIATYGFAEEALVAFLVGYTSHLVLDSLNLGGVPWFWPIKKKINFLPRPLRMRVYSGSDTVIGLLLLLASVWLIGTHTDFILAAFPSFKF